MANQNTIAEHVETRKRKQNDVGLAERLHLAFLTMSAAIMIASVIIICACFLVAILSVIASLPAIALGSLGVALCFVLVLAVSAGVCQALVGIGEEKGFNRPLLVGGESNDFEHIDLVNDVTNAPQSPIATEDNNIKLFDTGTKSKSESIPSGLDRQSEQSLWVCKP